MTASEQQPSSSLSWLGLWPWVALLLILAAANASVLIGLFDTWRLSYSETGHGFIAAPLAIYTAWLKKDELLTLPRAGSVKGLVLMIFSILLVTISQIAQWVFFSQLAVWLTLVGAIWFLLGKRWLTSLAFPLFLLFLTIPPPSFLYTRLTFELQLLASRLAEFGLDALGYSVFREGNILRMVGGDLNVAEACSGIRSLVTLVFFVTVYGYFVVEKPRRRWALVLTAVPLAVLANGLRIVATGVMTQYDRSLAEGFTHELSGYVTLFATGLLCVFAEQSWPGGKQATA